MFPQLLFIYIKNLRNCFYNQEFSFTNDFDITFQSNKLQILKKANPYNCLWGDNISNINLIVGKNGTGKTTLFDLLGSTRSRRVNLFNQYDENGQYLNEWFAVYSLKGDTFVIEGYNSDLLENLEEKPKLISNEYSICIKYNFEKTIAKYTEYIQFKGLTEEEYNYRLENNLLSIYLTNNKENRWFFGNSTIEDEQDSYVGFKRKYLNNPQMSDIYTFINKGLKNLENSFSFNNALCQIKRVNAFDYLEKEKIFDSLDLNLYKDKNEILIFKNDFSLEFLIGKSGKNVEKWTKKEKFIIKFLESIIIDLWLNTKIRNNKDLEVAINAINNDLSEKDSLKARIEYLINILEMMINLLDSINGFENNKKSIELIKKFNIDLQNTKDKYFTSDSTIMIRLSDEYDEQINSLLSTFDEFLLSVYKSIYPIEVKFKNMSAGEVELVDLFSKLYTVIRIATYNSEINTVLLLLDEPDLSFHPEWSRKYIYNLCRLLNEVDYGKEIKYQIIITTHSPFIVSDIPKEHITTINISTDENGQLIRETKKAEFGLMSNFYDIIQNDFFIDLPIGEFAKNTFNKIVENINEWTSLEEDEQEIKMTENLISSIDEKIIQMKLLQLFYEKKVTLQPIEDKLKRINEIERELYSLKKSVEGDNYD